MTDNKIRFEVGQEVVIRRSLGSKTNHSSTEYYHGGSIEYMPLGTKATIDRIANKDKIHLKFKNSRYGNSGGWYVHPKELSINEEQEMAEREEERRIDSFLESTLLKTQNNLLEDNAEKEEFVEIRGGLLSRLKNRIFNYFGYSKLIANENKMGRKFQPKFNAREEFAVWVRQEFPELKEHVRTRAGYKTLKERRKEVLGGARQAYEHADKTSQSCIREEFRVLFKGLNGGKIGFARKLERFVLFIEYVSVNLNDRAHRHHGTY